MIKVTCDKGIEELEVSGTLEELIEEALAAISAEMKKDHKEDGPVA